jgi:hypothetical protein
MPLLTTPLVDPALRERLVAAVEVDVRADPPADARRVRRLALAVCATAFLPWATWPMIESPDRLPSFVYAWLRPTTYVGIEYPDMAVMPVLLMILIAVLAGRAQRPTAALAMVAAAASSTVICLQLLVDFPAQGVTPCLGAILAAGLSAAQLRAVGRLAVRQGSAPDLVRLGGVLCAAGLLGDWFSPLGAAVWWNPADSVLAVVGGDSVIWGLVLLAPIGILFAWRTGGVPVVVACLICVAMFVLDAWTTIGWIRDGYYTVRIGPAATLYLLGGCLGLAGWLRSRRLM